MDMIKYKCMLCGWEGEVETMSVCMRTADDSMNGLNAWLIEKFVICPNCKTTELVNSV